MLKSELEARVVQLEKQLTDTETAASIACGVLRDAYTDAQNEFQDFLEKSWYPNQLPTTWQTAKGKKVRIADMDTEWLYNTVRMLWNHLVPKEHHFDHFKRYNHIAPKKYMRRRFTAMIRVLDGRKLDHERQVRVTRMRLLCQCGAVDLKD